MPIRINFYQIDLPKMRVFQVFALKTSIINLCKQFSALTICNFLSFTKLLTHLPIFRASVSAFGFQFLPTHKNGAHYATDCQKNIYKEAIEIVFSDKD